MAPRIVQLLFTVPLLLAVATAASAGVDARATAVTVDRVIDGDTLVVRGGARIRLLQIDAPESGTECYSGASRLELVRLARPGSQAVLEVDPALDRVDRYGRLLRYVHARGRNVNVELVRRGAATPWFYKGDRGRYAARLLAATAAARAGRRGMWTTCLVSWTPNGPVDTRPR